MKLEIKRFIHLGALYVAKCLCQQLKGWLEFAAARRNLCHILAGISEAVVGYVDCLDCVDCFDCLGRSADHAW
jgi:hypothetical protein